MKSVLDLANANFRSMKPCIHGADVLEASWKTGLGREEILDFSSSVNPLGPSKKALEATRSGFGQISSYPDSYSNELREAISGQYPGISKANVIVGNGSTELIYLFAEAFMQKGDVALAPAPSFGEYANAVWKAGGKVKYVKLDRKFRADPSAFARAMTNKTKIVYFCNPNNPTSILAPSENVIEIIQSALERDALVFLDEDFLEFVDDGESLSMIGRLEEFPNLFILRSFTKIFGLTGLRVGYGIASKEIVSVLMNAKLPWNVNCLGQAAAVAALSDIEHLKRTREIVKEEKTFLLRELTQFKEFQVYSPDANFIFMDISKSSFRSSELKEKMLNQGILIRDCSSFEGLNERYVRVAVKTRAENKQLISAFNRSLGKQV